jgi:xylulokinase
VTGTNDQYAGALGAGNCRPGILSETSGTCLAQVTLTRQLPPLPAGLIGGNFPIPGYHFVLAFAKTAGLVLDWFQRELADDESLDTLDAAAAHVPIGCRGLTASPHFDGAISPQLKPTARGLFSGLTLQHTRADLYRAILESLAFNARENISAMRAVGLKPRVIRAIGGGAKSDFRLQMKADVTGLPVEKPAVTEAAILGAAMIAAVGAGEFASLPAASAAWYRCQRTFKPDRARAREYQPAFERYLQAQTTHL